MRVLHLSNRIRISRPYEGFTDGAGVYHGPDTWWLVYRYDDDTCDAWRLTVILVRAYLAIVSAIALPIQLKFLAWLLLRMWLRLDHLA